MVLTRNASAAAPIRVCRDGSTAAGSRGVVNSGNANAETGEKGYADALAMCRADRDELGLAHRDRRRRRARDDRRARCR